MTVGYLMAARVVLRSRWGQWTRRARRAGVTLLLLDATWHVFAALAVLPAAGTMVNTGENSIPLALGRAEPVINGVSYSNEHVVHFYEAMLGPWAFMVAALALAVPALLFSDTARRHVGLPPAPTPAH